MEGGRNTWNARQYYEACRLMRVAASVSGDLRKALERRAADTFWMACGIEGVRSERDATPSLTRGGAGGQDAGSVSPARLG